MLCQILLCEMLFGQSLTAVDVVWSQKFQLPHCTIPAPHLKIIYRHKIKYLMIKTKNLAKPKTGSNLLALFSHPRSRQIFALSSHSGRVVARAHCFVCAQVPLRGHADGQCPAFFRNRIPSYKTEANAHNTIKSICYMLYSCRILHSSVHQDEPCLFYMEDLILVLTKEDDDEDVCRRHWLMFV